MHEEVAEALVRARRRTNLARRIAFAIKTNVKIR